MLIFCGGAKDKVRSKMDKHPFKNNSTLKEHLYDRIPTKTEQYKLQKGTVDS